MTEQNRQSMLLSKIAAYTEILVKDPRSTIFVSLAETYRKLGLLEDSRRIIEKGLEQHPDFSPAHIVLARVLCQLADYSGSQQAFETALELDPESLAAFVGYARVKLLLGEEAAARDLLLRARQLSPADPVINKLLLGLPQEADEEVDEEISAETIAETNAEIQEVATPEHDDSEDESAEPVTEAAAAAATPLISSTLAELYLRQGLKEQALNVYRQLLQRRPDDLSLRRVIKELEAEFSDSKEADSAQPLTLVEDPAAETSTETAAHEPEPETDPAATEPPATEPEASEPEQDSSASEQILTTLNQWLYNIQQRRGHV